MPAPTSCHSVHAPLGIMARDSTLPTLLHPTASLHVRHHLLRGNFAVGVAFVPPISQPQRARTVS